MGNNIRSGLHEPKSGGYTRHCFTLRKRNSKTIYLGACRFYRIFPFLEVGAGGRLNNIATDIDVRRNVLPAGTEEVTGSASKTWFDPIIIARISADIKDKWLFQLSGDLGGFGVGSDFTWQLQAYAGYRFAKLFQLTAGYRIFSN